MSYPSFAIAIINVWAASAHDNNGLAQLVNNLLSPVTSLLPVLKKNGVDVEVIIKALAGKSLNGLVKDALGVNIHLNLNNLNKCEIQNAIVPLVNIFCALAADHRAAACRWCG